MVSHWWVPMKHRWERAREREQKNQHKFQVWKPSTQQSKSKDIFINLPIFEFLSSESTMSISSQYIHWASLLFLARSLMPLQIVCFQSFFLYATFFFLLFLFFFFSLFIHLFDEVRFIALFDFWLLGHWIWYSTALHMWFFMFFFSFSSSPISNLKFNNLHSLPAIFGMIF